MRKYNKKILVLVLASCLLTATPSFATVKLEFTGPMADILNKIEKVKEKIEDIQSKILKEKEKWTKKAEAFMDKTLGTEGAALFKQYVVKPGAGIVKSAAKGQFNAGDYSLSGFTDAIKSDIGNYKLDYATLAAQSRDIIAADSTEKQKKREEIKNQLAELNASWQVAVEQHKILATNDEDTTEIDAIIEDLQQRIASLEKQQTEISNDVTAYEKNDKLQAQMVDIQKFIADQSAKLDQDDLLKKLNAEAMSLFTSKDENEDTKALYAEKIDKLFLGKFIPGSSANVAKIRNARKKEFFKSEENSVYVIVNTYKSIAETKDKMLKCDQARDQAQAVLGQEGMRVCLDIQVAKVAAQYMEMLLAQMRMESAAEFQKWTTKDRLPSYTRDYTKFNLDDYVITKDDLKPGLKKIISGKVNNAINSFQGL